jgi:hypothetical protein
VLGEFGDDRTSFSSPKSGKNYAGTSPVTKASGRSYIVLARCARNRCLTGALDQWAFFSLTSPQAPAATMTRSSAGAKLTIRRSASSPTAGLASSTHAWGV